MKKFYTGTICQTFSAFGYISDEPFMTPNINNPTTYYCAFRFNTYTVDGKFTILMCYVDVDQAYSFYESYHKYDTMYLSGEVNHVFDPITSKQTNRVHILGWATLLSKGNNLPSLSEDEAEAVNEFLQAYRSHAPLPTDEEIKRAKAKRRGWEETRIKK